MNSPSDDHPSNGPAPNAATIEEELVAYLDGELAAAEAQLVEQRLVDDAAYRQTLQQLQRTWDLLDELPRATPDESFTQTTVEMVAVATAADTEQFVARQQRQATLRWVLLAVAGGVAATITFLTVQSLLQAPNRQLARDLPLIQDLDMYRVADSVEFLQALEREGLFVEEADDAL